MIRYRYDLYKESEYVPGFLKIPGFIVEKCLQCDYACVKSKQMLVI